MKEKYLTTDILRIEYCSPRTAFVHLLLNRLPGQGRIELPMEETRVGVFPIGKHTSVYSLITEMWLPHLEEDLFKEARKDMYLAICEICRELRLNDLELYKNDRRSRGNPVLGQEIVSLHLNAADTTTDFHDDTYPIISAGIAHVNRARRGAKDNGAKFIETVKLLDRNSDNQVTQQMRDEIAAREILENLTPEQCVALIESKEIQKLIAPPTE